MTKYIDLLREHEQEKTTKSKSASKQKKGGKKKDKMSYSSTIRNPYASQKEHDHELLDNIDALLEEDTTTEPADEIVPHDDEYLIDESSENLKSSSTPQEKESITTPVQQNTPPIPTISINTDQGFDIPAWLQQINQTILSIFAAAKDGHPLNTSALHEYLRLLLEQVETSTPTLDALELEINKNIIASVHEHHDCADLAQKAMMMMLYTIKVGLQLKLQYQELLPFTIAAMLHHIGMAMIPSNIRLKAGKLSKSEIQQIRQSPEIAMAYLKSSVADEQITLAISQAAERYDGSGPTGLTGYEISWIARLVGLLSIFEALIHFRPYRQRLLPRDAIRDLVNHHKKEFDPVMLKALIESISLYPVGTFVQINTGEIGLVISVHNKFPLRPVVHINMDQHGNLITERRIDLKQQPNLMIKKCMYEEALEELRKEQGH